MSNPPTAAKKQPTRLKEQASSTLTPTPPDPDPGTISYGERTPTATPVHFADESIVDVTGAGLPLPVQSAPRHASRLPVSRAMIAQRRAAAGASTSSSVANPKSAELSSFKPYPIPNLPSTPSKVSVPRPVTTERRAPPSSLSAALLPQAPVKNIMPSRRPEPGQPTSTGLKKQSGIPIPRQIPTRTISSAAPPAATPLQHPVTHVGPSRQLKTTKPEVKERAKLARQLGTPMSRQTTARSASTVPSQVLKFSGTRVQKVAPVESNSSTAQAAFDVLRVAMEDQDADLFAPLHATLVQLIKVASSLEVRTCRFGTHAKLKCSFRIAFIPRKS